MGQGRILMFGWKLQVVQKAELWQKMVLCHGGFGLVGWGVS